MGTRAPIQKPPGIWIIDALGHTTFANVRMAQILGTSVDELMRQDSFAYVYPEDLDAARRLFDQKQQGNAEAFPFRLRRKDGSPIDTMIQGTPRFDASGAFQGVVGTFSVVEEG